MKIIVRCIGNWNRRKKGGTKLKWNINYHHLFYRADFCNLEEGIRQTEENGAVYLHFDVMDGVFVPSISFGMPVLASIKPAVKQVIDTHLMITEPIRYVEHLQRQERIFLLYIMKHARIYVRLWTRSKRVA